MKTKNISLGILAAMLAIGTAFASSLTPKPIRVKARVTESGPISCIATNVACNDPGAFACKVQLNATTGPDVTSKTYKDSNCSVNLTNTTANSVLSTTEVYELVEFALW